MKKTFYIIFIALFMAIALVPFVGMLFYKTDGAAEQRTLAEMPKLIEDGKLNDNVGTDYEDYFGDHFAFRTELVDADAAVKMNIFKTSSESKVITGRDNWLYYTETLGSYSGTALMTDGEIERLAHVIELESDYCREAGKGYVFTVAPNKNSVYPENMAAYYLKTDKASNLDRLNSALEKTDVNVLDLKKTLVEAKKGGKQLYYTYDSHWNMLGAMTGYNALLEAIQKECDFVPAYKGFTEENISDGEREGDLLKMVRPLNAVAPEKYASESLSQDFKYVGKPPASMDELTIKTKLKDEGADTTKILMFRDSFGRAIVKPLSNTFSSATYLRAMPFAISQNIDADTVTVREIVERNIPLLLGSAPVVPAPEQVGPTPFDPTCDCAVIDFTATEQKTETVGALTHFFGCGTSNHNPDNYRVYVKTADGKIYEAFPLVESSLENAPEGAIGYSFYLPSNVDATGLELKVTIA